MAKIVVIAGMSGAGRTVAAGALEDSGWFVIDNLPAALVTTVGGLAVSAGQDYEKIALVIGGYDAEMSDQVQLLRTSVDDVTLIFLEASKETLVTRFKTTKRRHPLAADIPLADAIAKEKIELQQARAQADLVIDTSELNPYQLRERITEQITGDSSTTRSDMKITLLSFGFKHGLPRDVDLMFDVRFMPNPHWVPELKQKTGKEKIIQDYVSEPKVSQKFLTQLEEMLNTLLPAYVKEGKSYLTVALGCTGGKHRSVSVTEIIGKKLVDAGWDSVVRHRDIGKK